MIAEEKIRTIPQHTQDAIKKLKHFVTERNRTARRFIKLCDPPYALDDLELVEIDKDEYSHIEQLKQWINEGHNVGVISESGMPSVADPGSDVMAFAHANNIEVVPLVGPSSIIMALAASGLNGQNFCFHGYLAIKDHQLRSELKKLEQQISSSGQTQIFIETPYRNDRMFKMLIKSLNANIKLCVARDITGDNELIQTKPLKLWARNTSFQIGKHPCIFLLGK